MISFHEQHEKRAFFYTPFSFLRSHENKLVEKFIANLKQDNLNGDVRIFGTQARWIVRFLKWDSEHFDYPTYRLEFADWNNSLINPIKALADTLTMLKLELENQHGKYYLFAEIPSEDTLVLQAMGLANFRLIETRLSYFCDKLENFSWPQRFPVRPATKTDIPHLRNVATQSINHYDRYHADAFFSTATANEYLATFIENSINGFADIVLVPKEEPELPGAFFTANFILPQDSGLDINLARIVLVAVSPERRGWHLKLLTEMCYYFQQRKVNIICMTTQSTNRAVIHNCEKLGYKYGRCTHILADYSRNE